MNKDKIIKIVGIVVLAIIAIVIFKRIFAPEDTARIILKGNEKINITT